MTDPQSPPGVNPAKPFLIEGRGWIFKLLTSVSFAIAQILFIALAVLVSAVMPKEHSRDLYDSLWFWALLILLALSMLCVAWKRRPYPAHRIGFLLVHISASLILAGALWGKFNNLRAYRELRIGEPANTFSRMKREQVLQDTYALPGFQLRLDKVIVAQSGPAYRLYAYSQPDGKGGFEKEPKAFDVANGLTTRLPHSKLSFQVEQIIPNALDAGEFINNPKAPENPALRVMLGIGTPAPLVGDLLARGQGKARRDEPGGRFAVVYQDRWSEGLFNRLNPGPPTAEKLVMTFMGKTMEHATKVGSTWDFPAFRLKVEKAYPDFAVKQGKDGKPEAYTRSQTPLEPWLELQLENPDGSTRRVMLSAGHPDVSDQLNEPNLPKGLSLRYVREGEERQSRFVVFTREDSLVRLIEKGRVVHTEPLSLSKPFVVQKGLSVTPVAMLDHAEFVPNFMPHPDPKEAMKLERPVLKVKVWDPSSSQSQEKWLDAKGPEGTPIAELFLDGRARLIYQPAILEPKDFRSVLVVLDEQGRPVAEKAASIHDPLKFRGYRFYPDGGAPASPGVSGIIVVRESGLWLSYLGFLCLLVGIVWMFYLKPVLKRRADEKKEA